MEALPTVVAIVTCGALSFAFAGLFPKMEAFRTRDGRPALVGAMVPLYASTLVGYAIVTAFVAAEAAARLSGQPSFIADPVAEGAFLTVGTYCAVALFALATWEGYATRGEMFDLSQQSGKLIEDVNWAIPTAVVALPLFCAVTVGIASGHASEAVGEASAYLVLIFAGLTSFLLASARKTGRMLLVAPLLVGAAGFEFGFGSALAFERGVEAAMATGSLFAFGFLFAAVTGQAVLSLLGWGTRQLLAGATRQHDGISRRS